MPRIRTIKPQFWTDERVGLLTVGARLLFIGTWNLADDEGILMWDARYLKGQLFPYDNVEGHMKRWMKQLVDSGLVRPYSTSGNSHLALIPTLGRHQVISHPHPSNFELPTIFPDFVPKYTPNSSNVPDVSGNNLASISNKEQVISNKEEDDVPPLSNIYQLYESNIGMLTPFSDKQLKDAEKEYPAEWIEDAIKEAVKYNKRNLAYIGRILERWKTQGRGSNTGEKKTIQKPGKKLEYVN
ncbi:MAG: DnaD domain protein [Candidatus Bipolaricaulis sp.]|nr:DnaD domain protein [Candidatus Bipolaricaulis sp.]